MQIAAHTAKPKKISRLIEILCAQSIGGPQGKLPCRASIYCRGREKIAKNGSHWCVCVCRHFFSLLSHPTGLCIALSAHCWLYGTHFRREMALADVAFVIANAALIISLFLHQVASRDATNNPFCTLSLRL